jgi:large subunit ribosomal protein L15
MKFNELDLTAKRSRRRVGRGIAAGRGKTAGRGTKGQKSRTGSGRRPGFEGGQNPLMQRLPKLRGFTSNRVKAETVYTGQLNSLGAKVDNFSLAEVGLVTSPYVRVKLITKGELSKKVAVHLQAASKSAVESLQKKGGSFEVTPQVKRQKKEKTDTK